MTINDLINQYVSEWAGAAQGKTIDEAIFDIRHQWEGSQKPDTTLDADFGLFLNFPLILNGGCVDVSAIHTPTHGCGQQWAYDARAETDNGVVYVRLNGSESAICDIAVSL